MVNRWRTALDDLDSRLSTSLPVPIQVLFSSCSVESGGSVTGRRSLLSLSLQRAASTVQAGDGRCEQKRERNAERRALECLVCRWKLTNGEVVEVLPF